MTVLPLASARVIKHAAALLSAYDVVFCDVWGVVHDGRRAIEPACAALTRFRDAGGTVVLVSNAPTPRETVAKLLDDKGVDRAAWDALVTSGDITRRHLAEKGYRRLHHIGPDRDLSLFETLEVERVPLRGAEAIVATGLVDDELETADSYRKTLEKAHGLQLPMVCANPDLLVEVAGRIYPCAGALAQLYTEIGGAVYWAGKPHRVAYGMAEETARELRGKPTPRERVLVIGDAVRTDLAGAKAFGLDSLFIAGGIHRLEVMPQGYIEGPRLERLLAAPAPWPVAAMETLVW